MKRFIRCDRITLLNRIFRPILKATHLQYIIPINISCWSLKWKLNNFDTLCPSHWHTPVEHETVIFPHFFSISRRHMAYRCTGVVIASLVSSIPDTVGVNHDQCEKLMCLPGCEAGLTAHNFMHCTLQIYSIYLLCHYF